MSRGQYMLPIEDRVDPPAVRDAQQRLDRQREIQGMFGIDDETVMHADWRVSDEQGRTPEYQQWASAVPGVMDEKVISAKAVAYILPLVVPGFQVSPEDAARIIGGDYASMNDVVEAATRIDAWRNGADITSPEFADTAARKVADVQRVMATGYGSEGDVELASMLRDAVAMHGPNQHYAQYAGRTPEEAAEADRKYGADADTYLTPSGMQNHRALRVSEFLSAADHNYAPENLLSRAGMAAGVFTAPLMRGMQDAVYGNAKPFITPESMSEGNQPLTPLGDAMRLSTPGGKFGYAMDLLRRSAVPEQGEYRVATPEDRQKFYSYDPYNALGLAHNYLNASTPVGNLQNRLANMNKWGDFIGHAMESGLPEAADYRQAARDVRVAGNRITPRQIEGVTPEQFQTAVDALRDSDTKSDSYASALLGPPLSGGKSYLSPFASGAANILGDLLADPINAAYTTLVPVGGAVSSAVKAASGAKTMIPRLLAGARAGVGGYGRGLASAAGNLFGDAVDEGVVEPLAFSPAMDNIFEGQRDNALMGNMDPGDVTVQKVMDANADRLYRQQQALRPIVDAMRKKRKPPQEESPLKYGAMRTQY